MKSSFRETIQYFSERLGHFPPKADLDSEEVEIAIDTLQIRIVPGRIPGSLHLWTPLGFVLHPLREERLKELAVSNFLGINTYGCKLAFDEGGITLDLHAYTSSGATAQDHWEWLHRLVTVAREWLKVLSLWQEFVPLGSHGN